MPNPISTSLTLNVLKIYQNFLSQGIYAIKCSKTGRNRGGNSILKYWYTILDTEKFEIYLQFIEHFNCLCHIDLQIFKNSFHSLTLSPNSQPELVLFSNHSL